ncbi:MAG: hypothetical protein DLM62_14715 [Pseudonocardiales bacterium]|nr:MAG: hypothetical protein DLM62_14715 [Pseudonocardiales bacterium]
MDTHRESEEPERREGLGGRVRRFIDSELNRTLDKRDRETDEVHPVNPSASTPGSEFDRPPTTDRPRDDSLGSTAHPVTTAPVESPYSSSVAESPEHHVPVHDPRVDEVDEVAGDRAHDRSNAEAAADGSAERVGLLTDPAGLRDQWQRVQSTFVDDPQAAVHEAGMLVERTLQEIQRNVARGQTGNPTSTEDLRVSFQRYREFFQRLLSA